MRVLLLVSSLQLTLAPRGLPNPWQPPSSAGTSSTFHRVDVNGTSIPCAARAAVAFTAAATVAAATAACASKRQGASAGLTKTARAAA
eukprot:196667-Pleurochrysis_carterae.AAC.1